MPSKTEAVALNKAARIVQKSDSSAGCILRGISEIAPSNCPSCKQPKHYWINLVQFRNQNQKAACIPSLCDCPSELYQQQNLLPLHVVSRGAETTGRSQQQLASNRDWIPDGSKKLVIPPGKLWKTFYFAMILFTSHSFKIFFFPLFLAQKEQMSSWEIIPFWEASPC